MMSIKRIPNAIEEAIPGQGIMRFPEIFQGTIMKKDFENRYWLIADHGYDFISYPSVKKQVDAADRTMANIDLATKKARRFEVDQLAEAVTQKAMMRIGAAELLSEVAHSKKPTGQFHSKPSVDYDWEMANIDLATKKEQRFEVAQLAKALTQTAMMRIGAAELPSEVAHSEKPTAQFFSKPSVDYDCEMIVSNHCYKSGRDNKKGGNSRRYKNPNKDDSDCSGCRCVIL